MRFNATIHHRGALAFYVIDREAPGIYSAELTCYEGDNYQVPPAQISLVRGIRQWAGSVEDKKILNALGATIEKNLGELSALNDTEKVN